MQIIIFFRLTLSEPAFTIDALLHFGHHFRRIILKKNVRMKKMGKMNKKNSFKIPKRVIPFSHINNDIDVV